VLILIAQKHKLTSVFYFWNGNGQEHRDPFGVRVKVVSRKRMKEIRGYLRRYPLSGSDDIILLHENNIL